MGSKPTKTEKTIRIVESDSSFGKQILKKYSDIIPPTIQQTEKPTNQQIPLPQPSPSKRKKNEIFQREKFVEIDKLSREFNIMKNNDWDSFTEYMKSISKTKIQLVRALFSWITSIDFNTLEQKVEDLPEAGTPLDYMLKIQWNMGNHAYFLAMCCRVLEIPCKIINGINKSAAYQIDTPIDRELLTAQWNAVLIDNEWRLIDILWASTCVIGKTNKSWTLIKENEDGENGEVEEEEQKKEPETFHRVNEFFFLTDPEKIIYTHLPDVPHWQLLQKEITQQQWAEQFYVRERYFELNMKNELTNRVIQSKTGEVTITFTVDNSEQAEKNINFKFLLYHKAGEISNGDISNFENYIFYSKLKEQRIFKIQFPVKGMFKLDIFGTDKSRYDGYDLACSYLIINDKPLKVEPLPDIPEIGWGVGIEAKEKGIEAKSHQSPIIETSDGKVELRFNLAQSLSVLQNLRSNSLDELLLSKHTLLRTEGDEMVISLRLPKGGDYALKLFADGEGVEGDLPNVCNYLIKCLKEKDDYEAYPKTHEGVVGKSFMASKLGISALNNSPIIQPVNGKIKVSFQKENDDIELYAELTSNNYDPSDLFQRISKETDNSSKNDTFEIDLPGAGEFALNVYSLKRGSSNKLYHVHTYLIDNGNSKGSLPLNQDLPFYYREVVENFLDICLPANGIPLYAEFQKKNAQGFNDENFSVNLNGKNNIFHLEFPENGEYKMDVYRSDGSKALQQICTYQFWKMDPPTDILEESREVQEVQEAREVQEKTTIDPEPKLLEESVIDGGTTTATESEEKQTEPANEKTKEEIAAEKEKMRKLEELKLKEREYAKWRELLKQAMSKEDPNQISIAMRNFTANKVPDKIGLMVKAQQLYDYLTISEQLSSSMAKRDLPQLRNVIKKALASSVSKKLNLQIKMAQRIEGQLEKLEKLRHAIMNLDQKTVAELKSYNAPPQPAHLSMIATFLLLGEKESDLKNWKNVVAYMGKTGKLNLKRRVTELRVENIPVPIFKRAKDYLKNLQLNHVRDVSSAAATFFVWSKGMIEEAESRCEQAGNDFDRTTSSMGVKR